MSCGYSIQTGIRQSAAHSKYVLCLDDDVILHPRMLQQMITCLEDDPSLFMATGTILLSFLA